MQPNQTLCFTQVQRFLTSLLDGDMHAKRVLSLANATLGVIKTASLAVHTIGQGLALARRLLTRDDRCHPAAVAHVDAATLKNNRNKYEYQVLVRLADDLLADVRVCIVADGSFGDQNLHRVLSDGLKFSHLIRFHGNITVTAAHGEVRTAGLAPAGGRVSCVAPQ